MDLARLFSQTAVGVPVVMWAFLVAVTILSVWAAVAFVGRPPRADQGS